MNKIVILLVVAAVAGAGWYLWSNGSIPFMQPSESGQMEENMEGSITEENEVVVTLLEQNDSAESGTATITETADGVRVVLQLNGAPAGVAQPAHIHVNSCANIGGVEYPLTSPVDGYSETMLDVSMEDLQAGQPLSLNVHKSAEEVSVYVACGDIMIP